MLKVFTRKYLFELIGPDNVKPGKQFTIDDTKYEITGHTNDGYGDIICHEVKPSNKYRKKPVVIEAIQFIDDSRETLKSIQDFTQSKAVISNAIIQDIHIEILTLEGTMRANIGDWIIKGVNGEFYPCKPDIFEKTYEPAEGSTKSAITDKERFLIGFDNPAYREVAIEVTVPNCPDTELIINSKANFPSKKAYYEMAYNEDLELKTFNRIKIVGYHFR